MKVLLNIIFASCLVLAMYGIAVPYKEVISDSIVFKIVDEYKVMVNGKGQLLKTHGRLRVIL